MDENWTGSIVAALHVNRIKQIELAKELNVTVQYVSMVLNGKKESRGMKERMEAAIDAIVERRAGQQ